MSEEKLTMDDFSAELEASFKKIEEGDMLTGTVISVDEKEVILDLKYYAEGVIRAEDFSNEPGFSLKDAVQVGDEITATVIRQHSSLPRRGKRYPRMGKTRTVQRRENRTGCKSQRNRKRRCYRLRRRNPRLYPGIQAFPELCGRSERILKQRHSGSGF